MALRGLDWAPSGALLFCMLIEAAFTLMATFYAGPFIGRPTASGTIYTGKQFTAASIDIPLGTDIIVTRGRRSLVVRVDDRCPIPGRIDLSVAAAKYLGIYELGKGRVSVRILRRAKANRARDRPRATPPGS